MSASCQGGETAEPPSLDDLPTLPDKATRAVAERGESREARELQIALVGEVRGEIEPCGCPTLPYGGFVRRQRLLEELRADGPLLQLDAGELLLKGLSTNRSESRVARADLLLELSRDVGVHAWVPGPTDLLALGLDGLRKLPGRAAPPAISATWTPKGTAEPLLAPSRVVELDGLKIGIVGFSAHPSSPGGRELLDEVDPVAAGRAALADLPADLDLLVGLGNLSDADADAVAEGLPELALLLTTRGEELDPPRTVGQVSIVETPARGRYLQLMSLRLGSSASEPVGFELDEQRWRDLLTLRQQAASKDETSEALTQLEEWFATEGDGRNLGYQRAVPLAPNLDGEAAVSTELDRFKEDTLVRARKATQTELTPLEPGYATNGGCTSCHTTEFARWSVSDHPKAWPSLLERQATTDPECIGCHTTGFGEPGGFADLEPKTLQAFKGVQCEACHGPMRGHPDDARVHSRPIDESTCTGCHDEANSPEFEYETYLRMATCQDMSAPVTAEQEGSEPGGPSSP